MTIRENILVKAANYLDDNNLNSLALTLDMVLNEYNITEKSREVGFVGNNNDVVLKNYLGSKILQGRSRATVQHYKRTLTFLFDDVCKPVKEITADDIRCHLAKWQTTKNISPVTLNNVRSVYMAFFGWCFDEELIEKNPMKKIDKFKEPKTHIKPLTDVEIEKLRSACTNTRDRALVEFLYSTGCRVSECCAINIDDINFRENKVVISKGKGDKERVAYISDVTMLWLEKYLNERKDKDVALWVGRKGRLTKGGVEAAIKKLGIKVGLPKVHPHQFRHALATDLVKKNVPIQIVKQILGHEDIATTMIYVDIQDADVVNAHKKYVA